MCVATKLGSGLVLQSVGCHGIQGVGGHTQSHQAQYPGRAVDKPV